MSELTMESYRSGRLYVKYGNSVPSVNDPKHGPQRTTPKPTLKSLSEAWKYVIRRG